MNCLINIHDMHLTDGKPERSEMITNAEIEGTAANYTVKYDEPSDEMKGCKTTIKVADGASVEIVREGAYNTVMKIEKGRRNICCYSTPVGNIFMGISANAVTSEFVNGRFRKLDFAYELDADGTLLSKNRIRITLERK